MTNIIELIDTNGVIVYTGTIIGGSTLAELAQIFLVSLALGTGISVPLFVYRKTKEGLNATSND